MAGIDSSPITVYVPHSRHQYGTFKIWAIMARNLYESRDLIWQLFKRDFLAQYKKSFVGYAWAIFTPLIGIASWVFLQATGVLAVGNVGVPYPVYVLIGTSMWGLFIGFFQSSSATLRSGEGLLTQVKFPHEALLVIQAGQQLANFGIILALNLIVLLAFGVTPAWQSLFLPLVCLPMFFLGAALGLIDSLISAVSIDLKRVSLPVLSLALYATPVIYSDEVDSAVLRTIIEWNPLTYLVCSARDIVLTGNLYGAKNYFIVSGISLALFLFSWRLFFVSEDRVIERLL